VLERSRIELEASGLDEGLSRLEKGLDGPLNMPPTVNAVSIGSGPAQSVFCSRLGIAGCWREEPLRVTAAWMPLAGVRWRDEPRS
jgi:hypothetical protein